MKLEYKEFSQFISFVSFSTHDSKNDPVYSEKETAFSLYSNVNVLFVFKPHT